jgi:hypothetical protein
MKKAAARFAKKEENWDRNSSTSWVLNIDCSFCLMCF